MEYRKIKIENEEKDVSLLGFGAMRFPTIEGEIDKIQSKKMILEALDNGVNYIDTAYPYHAGKSELFVGEVLSEIDRKSFYLANKLPLWDCKNEEDIDRIFHEQLEKCQVDYFDFYLIHAVNKERYDQTIELNVINKLEQYREQGKIKNIGFSFHDDYPTFVKWVDLYNWDFVQIQLNYMDVEHQQGIKGYNLLTEKNIPVIVMEPVKGGSLVDFNEDIRNDFKQMDPNRTIVSWAFRWVGSLPNVKVILSGMSTLNQVKDNLETFMKFEHLKAEELEGIKQIREKINSYSVVDCTSCRYCMPCPHGVDIPGNLRLFNNHNMYHNDREANWLIKSMKSRKAYAEACISCNICLDKCPQKINIPLELAKFQQYVRENGIVK